MKIASPFLLKQKNKTLRKNKSIIPIQKNKILIQAFFQQRGIVCERYTKER